MADLQPAQSEQVEMIDHRCSAGTCARRDSYVMEARCGNCEWEGQITVTVTHEASNVRSTARCPRCECRSIRTGNFIRREPRDG